MKIAIIYGTRPEAIKIAPLALELKKCANDIEPVLIMTGQHREMVESVHGFFGINADYNLDLMQHNQSLTSFASACLGSLGEVLAREKPDMVMVQGDTTTTLMGALAAFYQKIKVAHVEAGLRSGQKDSPFPEEANRTLVGHIADLHFAATDKAKLNLLNEGIDSSVFVVGNTAIDALRIGVKIVKGSGDDCYLSRFPFLDVNKRLLLATCHRRESFGDGLGNICRALREIAMRHRDVQIVFPMHPNPNVQESVRSELSSTRNIHLIGAVSYESMIWLMDKSHFILTDSGGIQEEAPTLGKPLLVMREVTERQEGLESGVARLVGTAPERILLNASELLEDSGVYSSMVKPTNPYGDGRASERIVGILRSCVQKKQNT